MSDQAGSPTGRTVTAPRRRAPAMSVAQRRAAIVEVALPLLVEHGASVTTSQIAAAAGIAEGTVFRAFRDKSELLGACFEAALESEAEVAQIAGIDRALPLVDRLTTAVRYAAGYQDRLWTVVQALRAAGIDPRDLPRSPDDREPAVPRAMIRVSAALAALFDPDDLRVAPELAARLLLGLVFSNRMNEKGFGPLAELPELVELFLHGALRPGADGGRS